MHIRPFEIALIGFFGIAAFTGLIFLRMYQAAPSTDELLYGDRVIIWGTLDERVMNDFLAKATDEVKALDVVSYEQKDPRTIESDFVNAVAEGKSPDLLIISHSQLVMNRTKLTAISSEIITERMFRDAYVDGADIFLRSDGVYGLPFAVDPLVMYWNRDLFSSGGLAQPPRTWENVVSQTAPILSHVGNDRSISQSALAFGEYSNVAHAKDVIAMLFLQAGSRIIDETASGEYKVTIANAQVGGLSAGDAVFGFYTQFAMPSKDLYTWNRGKSLDRNEFTGGTLALYFGPGSEWSQIERENPNLNFDVTRVPQGAGATILRTSGEFYAFAIPKASQRAPGAFAVARLFSGPMYAQKLADAYGFAPVHRALFGVPTNSPLKDVLYQSALIAHGWLDPSPTRSGDVFRKAIEEITSGSTREESIILDAVHALEALF